MDFWDLFFKSHHERKMERIIPTVLSKAALLQQGPRYDYLIDRGCDPLYAPLNEVFEKVRGRLQSGSSFSQALREESLVQSSFLIRRMLILLAHGFDAGVDLRQVLSDTAHYMRERFSQLDEQASEVWVERMTLLASAGILIPFMSGSLAGLSTGSMNGPMMEQMGFGMVNQALVEAIHSGVAILQVELIVIASLLAAFLEGKPIKAVLYIAVLWPLSQVVWWIAGGM